jgi:hypothetical protein
MSFSQFISIRIYKIIKKKLTKPTTNLHLTFSSVSWLLYFCYFINSIQNIENKNNIMSSKNKPCFSN